MGRDQIVRPRNRFTSRSLGILLLLASLTLLPSTALALDFYVDDAIGNDARSTVEAQSAATPWKTINHALQTVQSGNKIRVKPGTYAESAESRFANVTLRASGDPGTVIIAPPIGQAGLVIEHAGMLIEGFVVIGGTHGIRATNADALVIRGCKAVAQTFNGFTVEKREGGFGGEAFDGSAESQVCRCSIRRGPRR